MTDPLRFLLDSYNNNTLRDMAEAAGLATKNSRGKLINKAELLELMMREFFTRERVQASLAKLNDRERAVLNRLLLHGGEVSTRTLRRELARAGLTTEPPPPSGSNKVLEALRSLGSFGHTIYLGDPHRPKSTVFEDVMARLTLSGLVFSKIEPGSGANYKLNFQPGSEIFIPPAIRPYLPEQEAIVPKATDWKPNHLVAGDPNLLLRDLYLYWDFVRKNPVELLQSGLVGKRSLKAINLTLLTPDPGMAEAQTELHTPRLYLLRLLLEALGLLRREQARVISTAKSAAEIPAFWNLPMVDQITQCLEVWLSLPHYAELGRDTEQFTPAYVPARRETLAMIKKTAALDWMERDDLLEQIQDRNINFLFPYHRNIENSRSDWYTNYQGVYISGRRQDLLERMQTLESRFMHHFLTEIMHPLGLIDLGYEQAASPNYAIRLKKPRFPPKAK
jgi:hypothetical protein